VFQEGLNKNTVFLGEVNKITMFLRGLIKKTVPKQELSPPPKKNTRITTTTQKKHKKFTVPGRIKQKQSIRKRI